MSGSGSKALRPRQGRVSDLAFNVRTGCGRDSVGYRCGIAPSSYEKRNWTWAPRVCQTPSTSSRRAPSTRVLAAVIGGEVLIW